MIVEADEDVKDDDRFCYSPVEESAVEIVLLMFVRQRVSVV